MRQGELPFKCLVRERAQIPEEEIVRPNEAYLEFCANCSFRKQHDNKEKLLRCTGARTRAVKISLISTMILIG